LGDLGVLLPITVALITLNHMDATSVFLMMGLAYVGVGLVYRVPIGVQPLKAVAAIAIAGAVAPSIISASGIVMAVILLLLALTGALRVVGKLFPKPVIRGIQLGVGLLLVKAGLSLANRAEVFVGGGGAFSHTNLFIPASWLLTIVAGGLFIYLIRSKRVPASLALMGLGVLIGVFWGSPLGAKDLHLGLSLPSFTSPSFGDLSTALVLLVIPQIPLTLGNAVFATAETAKTYFGKGAKKVTPKALLTTMGIANLGAGLLGGMPICHGAGGLTAHYRLGARTGGAGLMIGVVLVALALLVDGNVVPILSLIPYPVLGVLVIFAGVQHSLLARDLRHKGDISVAVAVAVVGLATTNLAYGFGAGIGLYWLLKIVSNMRIASFGHLIRTTRGNS
jgi:MFS superfamily sulfate permease-like transporter